MEGSELSHVGSTPTLSARKSPLNTATSCKWCGENSRIPFSGGMSMANKYYEEMETTDNPRVYSRARKGYLASSIGAVSCGYCRYHRGENMSRPQKNWKRVTKRRKQYKPI